MNAMHLAKFSLGGLCRLLLVQDIQVHHALADVTFLAVIVKNMLITSSDKAGHECSSILVDRRARNRAKLAIE